jgi:hypothetical protein
MYILRPSGCSIKRSEKSVCNDEYNMPTVEFRKWCPDERPDCEAENEKGQTKGYDLEAEKIFLSAEVQ